MKYAFLLLFAFLARQGVADDVCLVNGTWQRGKENKIRLYRVVDGALEEQASATLAADGAFAIAFIPEREGLFAIGADAAAPLQNHTFYFKPGDRLEVAVDAEGYVLTGKNTGENEELARWNRFVAPLARKAFRERQSTFVDFFPLLEEKAGREAYKQRYTKNKAFNACFAQVQRFDLLFNALSFFFSPRTSHPGADDFIPFYRDLDVAAETSSAGLLDLPHGKLLLDLLCSWVRIRQMEGMSPDERRAITPETVVEMLLPSIGHDLLKGAVVAGTARSVKTYDEMLAYEKAFADYLVTPAQRNSVRSKAMELLAKEKEQRTIDFKFRDAEGKMVALSDFKGRVVYVDVWATWCGPCKAEIPHLKRVEKAYHGREIVFISVSVDAEKDMQKWKDFVVAEGLGGIQLFAGNGSRDILEPYQIKGIPRFMLFGKDGNPVQLDAPRPSDPRLEAELDRALSR